MVERSGESMLLGFQGGIALLCTKFNHIKFAPIILVLVLLSGCISPQIYRSQFTDTCISNQPVEQCGSNAWQEYIDESAPEKNHYLGFIEFDDQGQLWDRRQMNAVMDQVNALAGRDDVILVTFVHGWKHNAKAGDDNIKTFRGTLKRLAQLEARFSQAAGLSPRKVVGVYLGWRGGSVPIPVLKELTFWDRKNTAHKVGHGGVTEVLTRLELVKKTRDAITANEAAEQALKKKYADKALMMQAMDEARLAQSRTRFAIIGHSFGGAVVFSALSQILESRFIDTRGPQGQLSNAHSFGDLVILINPAFEATRFATLSDMATERGKYFESQLPAMVVLTSKADLATRWAFPVGRWFSTLFESERDVERKNGFTQKTETIDQGSANVTAVGHFKPYRTHTLKRKGEVERGAIAVPSVEEDIQDMFRIAKEWENDEPGKAIEFFGSVLKRGKNSASRNPFLVVQVDKYLIRDHNDIADPRIIAFIRQVILLASQSETIKQQSLTLEKLMKQ
jgi:hypothetical protein